MLDHFGSPWFLLLLFVAVPAVFLLSRRSLAALSPGRRWTSIALRTLVVVLLIFALSESRLLTMNKRLAVIFLIDRSASVPPGHQNAALDFAKQASRYRDRVNGDYVGCIVFGRTAGIEAVPREQDLFSQDEGFSIIIERDVTDIQSAIRVALAAFPEKSGKRIVLVTDGNENRGAALEEARLALDEDVSIDVLSVRYSYPGEVLVEKVVVDPEIHVGEPFTVRVVVDSTRETKGTLRLFENGRSIGSRAVELNEGKNLYTVERRVDDASQHSLNIEASIEIDDVDADAVLQNNIATAFTFIRGSPRVLLCSDEPDLDSALASALRDDLTVVKVITPDQLPADVGSYLQYSAIVFSNVSAHHLSATKMRMIEGLVKGAGIGFVMIGGNESFGAGGYLGSPIEKMLPVYMDARQKKSIPNGALAVVMHSCEINNGNYWAKATVQQAIRVLSPEDWCGVLYYSHMGRESWLFPMMPCRNKGLMLNRLMNFNVGDMPDFARIFDMAHQGLQKTPAALKHIICFSDGDPSMPTDAKLEAINNDKITVSAISMGSHASNFRENMQKLAEKGKGNFYELTDPEALPEIFIREAITVRKALIQERDFQPQVQRTDGFLAGIDVGSLAPLRGYVITTAKETAEDFLKTPPPEGEVLQDPLLSRWYYGLGKSVAFTSDAGRRWAVGWTKTPQYQQIWRQILLWVSKNQSDDRFRVTHQRSGDRMEVFVDAVDKDGRFVSGLQFDANVVTPFPDFKSIPVEVRQVAAGRYQLNFDVVDQGNYLIGLQYEVDGRKSLYTAGLVNPYSPEYKSLATNDVLLHRIADVTGGSVLDEIENDVARWEAPFRRDFPASTTAQDVWRSLLHLAAFLFFLDVFVRRVMLDYAKLYRDAKKAVVTVVRRDARQEEPDDRLGKLLKKKAEVRGARSASQQFYTAPERGDDASEDVPPEAGLDSGADKRPPSAPERALPVDESTREPSKEESYTNRLLAAKRRALGGKDNKDN